MGGEGVTVVQMLRVKVNWTGFAGSPGYTNLYLNEFTEGDQTQVNADGAAAKVDTWVTAWQPMLAATANVQVDPVVDVVESTNGQLQGFFNVTPAAARGGTATGNYSAASGAVVNWYTAGVRNGRRVRGRTFLVPLGGTAMSATGNLDDTKLATLRTATTTFIGIGGTGDMGVWARPTTPGATDGVWHPTTAFTIPDKAAILTSRRD